MVQNLPFMKTDGFQAGLVSPSFKWGAPPTSLPVNLIDRLVTATIIDGRFR
jgi:hypothetical protein